MTPPSNDNFRGIVYATVSMLGASGMSIAIRGAGEELSGAMIAAMRSLMLFGVIVVGILIIPALRRQLKFSQPRLHIRRGLLFGISSVSGFYAITQIPLATSTVLFFMAPIFAAGLSTILLGQKIGPRRLAAIAAGFVGALVIIRPGYIPLNLGMLVAVFSSVCFAFGLVWSRDLGRIDGPFSTMFSSTVLTIVIAVPFVWSDFQLPSMPPVWAWLVLLVVVSIMRQISDIQAYRLADAAAIAPISYLRLVFIGIAAYFIFDEVPDQPTIIGATIIIGAAIYIAHRERRAVRIGPR